jgi:hypothetical protein
MSVFYNNHGIDALGTLRALPDEVAHHCYVEAANTITVPCGEPIIVLRRRSRSGCAAYECAKPGEELVERRGQRDAIVCACVQTLHAYLGRISSDEQKDRGARAVAAKGATDAQDCRLGSNLPEHDRVERPAYGQPLGVFRACGDGYLIPSLPQRLSHQLLILDQENVQLRHLHDSTHQTRTPPQKPRVTCRRLG